MKKKLRVLVLDNYDSFVYNLVYILKEHGADVDVVRNDKIDLDTVQEYDKILLSPGPGIPEEAGKMMELLERYKTTKSILGVCLGHQAIAEAFGGKLHNMGEVLHGVTTPCRIVENQEPIFKDLPEVFEVCRYHSWTVLPETLPQDMIVTAIDANGNVMAEAHKNYDVRGVQFHPEAYLTEHGVRMIVNWMNL